MTDETYTRNDTFPIGWDEWRKEWSEWLHAGQKPNTHYRPGLNHYGRSPFPPKNFLADEVLGVFRIGSKIVELSEITFPNLSERDESGRLIEKRVRMVGITYWVNNGEKEGTESGGVVSSFAELEAALGLEDVSAS